MNKDEKGILMSKRTQAIWCSYFGLILNYFYLITNYLLQYFTTINVSWIEQDDTGMHYLILVMFVAFLGVFAVMTILLLRGKVHGKPMNVVITIGFVLALVRFMYYCFNSLLMFVEGCELSLVLLDPIATILPFILFGLALYHRNDIEAMSLFEVEQRKKKLKALAILFVAVVILTSLKSIDPYLFGLFGSSSILVVSLSLRLIITFTKIVLLQHGVMVGRSLILPAKLSYVLVFCVLLMYLGGHFEIAIYIYKIILILIPGVITVLSFKETSISKPLAIGGGISAILMIIAIMFSSYLYLFLDHIELLMLPFYWMIFSNIMKELEDDSLVETKDIVNY